MTDKKSVLIVEDEESVRRIIVEVIQKLDCDVLQAKNGQEGLDIALSKHPDLILLDLMMPKLSGQQVCEKLRADEWGKDANIIILTNLDSDTEKNGLKDFNIKDYLVKANYKLEEIVEKVKKFI